MTLPDAARYDADPQLAIVESYALDVIGELSPEEVLETERAVTGLYGEGPGAWRPRVRKRMGWSPLIDAAIAEAWCGFRKASRAGGVEPDAGEFARRFADEAVRLSRC